MEDIKPSASLVTLPTELLLTIAQHSTWKSRHSLSQTNFRLRQIFRPTLTKAHRLSIKGCENVEFYLLDFQLDPETTVRREFKCMGGRRTEVKTAWSSSSGGEDGQKLTRQLPTHPRTHVISVFRSILQKYKLDRIEIGIDTFIPFLSDYGEKSIDTLGISDSFEGMEHAIRLQPKNLTIFGRSEMSKEKRVECVDLEKLPNLKTLHLYCSSISFDQFLSSQITTLITSSDTIPITNHHVNTLITQWQTGQSNNINHIQMSTASTWSPFSAYYYHHNRKMCREEEEDWAEMEEWDIPGVYRERIQNPNGDVAIVIRWNNEFAFYTFPNSKTR